MKKLILLISCLAASAMCNSVQAQNTGEEQIGSYDNQIVVYDEGYASVDKRIGGVFVKNFAKETLTQSFVVWVYPEEGGDSIDYFDLGETTLESEQIDYLEFSYKHLHSLTLPDQPQTLVPGQNYLLRLQNLTTGDFLAEPAAMYFRETITIEITLPESGWGTICLPVTTDTLAKDLSVYYIYEIVDDILGLANLRRIACNAPCIIHGTPGATYSFYGADAPRRFVNNFPYMSGSTEGDVYAPKDSYVLQSRDGITGFYKVMEDNQVLVKQYEAYLVPKTECGDFISLGEYYQPPTAIESINAQSEIRNTQSFDLSGKVVGFDQKGIVIRGGKVYIIK